MSEILTPKQVQECSDYYFVSPLARSHEALRADRDRLAAMTKNVRHCADCGGDWYDGGLNAPECPHCRITRLAAENARLRAMAREVVARYDGYRARGVMPAPDEYAAMVAGINALRAARAEAPTTTREEEES